MIWLTWRQFRTQTLVILILLAAAAVLLLITGTQMHNAYAGDLAACGPVDDCNDALSSLQSQYNGPLDLVQLLMMGAPALIGIFWGVPLIAGELERGTHHVAWNQSVTRTRWLAVKLAAVGFASVATAGLISLLVTWWASPLDTVTGSRFGTQGFNARNIVPIGYAVFAFAVGVTLGLLLRRTLPAMAGTIAIFVVVQILMTAAIRPHLLPATSTSVPINQSSMSQAIRFDRSDPRTGQVTIDLPVSPGAWILSESSVLDSSGLPISNSVIATCFDQVVSPGAAGKDGLPDFGSLGACLAPDNLHVDVTYEPAYRYWQLQWVETGIYTALAALLSLACFRRIRRLRG